MDEGGERCHHQSVLHEDVTLATGKFLSQMLFWGVGVSSFPP